MSQTDPYSPPQASLGGLTPSEQHDRDHGVLHYSTFWQRVGAGLIDVLVWSPVMLLEYFLAGYSRMYSVYALVPTELLSAYFYVYLVVRYGGTPGKLMMGLRIANLDGSRVTLKGAALRYAVYWILALGITLTTIAAALGITEEAYKALGYLERSEALEEQVPLINILTWLMIMWSFACLVTMLANKQRRTLHDFIAATVVLRK